MAFAACPFVALVLACQRGSLFAAVRIKDRDRQQILIHITDPQLGMLNMYKKPEDWKAEETMLSKLAAKAASFKPNLVFVGGDMQNWWPNEEARQAKGLSDRNRLKGMGDKEFQQLKDKGLGRMQRDSVQKSLEVLVNAKIPVYYTAGNHDVGDYPDARTLEQYSSSDSKNPGWGPLFQKVEEDGILYLQFNSQIYWSNEASLDEYRSKQLDFLEGEMSRIQALQSIKRLVLLTHIPPFMDSVDEQEGWANWKEAYRKQILDVLAGPNIPMLWVCGHFHANVEKDSDYQGVPLSIRVSSAAGTTMQWDGKDELSPKEAQEVASKEILKAFAEDIGFTRIGERLKAESDRSGLRIFKMLGDSGSFEDQWFTLDQLQEEASSWLAS